MKSYLKKMLKLLGVYHFLQSNYRQLLFTVKKNRCRISYAKYEGKGLECNCCGARYSKFVPDYPALENARALKINAVVAGYGENILCPACLSTARERLIIALLEDQFNITGKKILHFSPEKNIYRFIKANNEVITADIQPLFYKNIDSNIKNEDATQLSYPDSSFDVVIGNHIMEHIPNDIKAMAEIYRVLKPGGRAILQVPYSTILPATIENPDINDPQQQSSLYGQKDHVRIYALQNYMDRLQTCGFNTTLIEYKDLAVFYKNAIQINESFISILK